MFYDFFYKKKKLMQAYTIVFFNHRNHSKITMNLDPKPFEGPPFSNTNLVLTFGI